MFEEYLCRACCCRRWTNHCECARPLSGAGASHAIGTPEPSASTTHDRTCSTPRNLASRSANTHTRILNHDKGSDRFAGDRRTVFQHCVSTLQSARQPRACHGRSIDALSRHGMRARARVRALICCEVPVNQGKHRSFVHQAYSGSEHRVVLDVEYRATLP